MKHFQKILIYMVVLMINFVFLQTDLLSQNDSLILKDSLIIGSIYKVRLINDEFAVGKLHSYDSVNIKLMIDENVIKIKREKIKSMKFSKYDYSTKSGIGNSQLKFPFISIGLIGGGTFPFGNFSHGHDNGWCIGSDMSVHLSHVWAVYFSGTYNSFGYSDTIYSNNSSSNTEISTGIRLFLSKENVKMFGEASIGLNVYSTNGSISSKSNSYFGMDFGFGTDIQLNKNVDLVFKMNYHIFWVPKDVWFFWSKWTTYNNKEYIGFKLGLRFNFW